jgi:hypothetical protein
LGELKFLVDTGATHSLLVLNKIRSKGKIRNFNAKIRGIGGSLEIIGTFNSEWLGKSINFRVVKQLPIQVDGRSRFFKTI